MTLDDLKQKLAELEAAANAAIGTAPSSDAMRAARKKFLDDPFAEMLRLLKEFPPDQKRDAGQSINAAKTRITETFNAAAQKLREGAVTADRAAAAAFDPTLPAEPAMRGSLHPVTRVQLEVEQILGGLGFTVVGGPEMETDFYNFEALNIPATHPARDTMDTFWLTNGWLLRTHTSPCQVRAMLKYGPPLRVIAPGRCFRYETVDASHENTFHQLEGLLIDRDVSIGHLIAVMRLLLREIFKRDVKVRLRPGFFPFVEPGFELDMSCEICGAKGCPTCKQSGWVEILPCGMIHPNVLRAGKIDPHQFTGFAFGLGLTRLAMMKYGIADIRIINSGDLRGLVPADRLAGDAILAR